MSRFEGETFKSGEWRICAICTSTIKPKDKVGYVWDEVACAECAQSSKTDPNDGWMDATDAQLKAEDKRHAEEY